MSLAMLQKVFTMTAKTHAAERLMLLALADCYNQETGRCYPSVGTLQRMTGLTSRWASHTLQSLEKRGLIVRWQIRKPNGSGWCYSLKIPDTHEQNTGVVNTGVVCAGVVKTEQGAYSVPSTGVVNTPKQEYNGNTTGIHIGDFPIAKQSRFVKPSADDIRTYCATEGITNVNAEEFSDYYDGNGWMVGKVKMKDWKAMIRNWSRRSSSSNKAKQIFMQEGYEIRL